VDSTNQPPQLPTFVKSAGDWDVVRLQFEAAQSVLAPLGEFAARVDRAQAAIRFVPQALSDALEEQTAAFRRMSASVATSMQALYDRVTPKNWSDVDWVDAVEFVATTGWSIVWVPRAEIVGELIGADDPESVLTARYVDILEDVDEALAAIGEGDLTYFSECLQEAVDSARDGRFRSAQALTASVLTALVEDEFISLRKAALIPLPDEWGDVRLGDLRDWLIGSTLVRALSEFWVSRGDPIP
jgi:hypothetical protein